MRDFIRTIRHWAGLYEPAVAKTLVAAFFQILVAAGIGLGDLPKVADAVLAFLAIAATVLAGRSIRNSVYAPLSHLTDVHIERIRGYHAGLRDRGPRKDES